MEAPKFHQDLRQLSTSIPRFSFVKGQREITFFRALLNLLFFQYLMGDNRGLKTEGNFRWSVSVSFGIDILNQRIQKPIGQCLPEKETESPPEPYLIFGRKALGRILCLPFSLG